MVASLRRDVALLEGRGLALRQYPQPDGWTFLILTAYPLGGRFNRPSADLLIKVPPMCPYAGPDMFWADPDVRLADGRLPANTSIESILGRDWLRFSWHPAGWRQGVDTLATYLAFIDRRLANGG